MDSYSKNVKINSLFIIEMKTFEVYSFKVTTLLNLFVEAFSSIFIKCEFKHIWFMDQLTSLIGPIRDIEYTICYYTHYSSN